MSNSTALQSLVNAACEGFQIEDENTGSTGFHDFCCRLYRNGVISTDPRRVGVTTLSYLDKKKAVELWCALKAGVNVGYLRYTSEDSAVPSGLLI